MRLSFVIPAYNEGKYIGKCLDSIFKEIGDDPNVEVIVADNNSTDRTREIAASYPKVRVVVETKKGANSSRQAGYLAAQAELIANVDADTVLTPGWIERAEEEFRKNPELVCLSGPFIYYDLPKRIHVLVKIFYTIAYVAYLVNRFIFRNASMIQGGNYVVRKSALDKIGGHNTALTFYGDDADLAKRLNKVGKVKFTFGFPIYSSGRRLATEGTFTMGIRYGINYLWIIFFKRPFSQTSIMVRPERENGALTYRPVNRPREWIIASSLLFSLFVFLAVLCYLGYILVRSGVEPISKILPPAIWANFVETKERRRRRTRLEYVEEKPTQVSAKLAISLRVADIFPSRCVAPRRSSARLHFPRRALRIRENSWQRGLEVFWIWVPGAITWANIKSKTQNAADEIKTGIENKLKLNEPNQ